MATADPVKTPPIVPPTQSISPKKPLIEHQTLAQPPRNPETVTPKPLQLNAGYYDVNGDFIPPGVLKAPFSGKLFNISEKSGLDNFLKHLLEDYKLVIADLTKIADFTLYMRYWTERFDGHKNTITFSIEDTLANFCTPIQTNPLNPRPDKLNASERKLVEKVTYYLLADNLDEDKELRESLQIDRLEYVLSLQEQERLDKTFTGKCFFCKYRVTKGNRSDLILHMTQCHKFQIGHPDNIVLANEFISKIKVFFDDNICCYCVKKFKDKATLLDHMKKKKHRSLDPKNKDFDRYYVINYLEPGKHWSDYQDEIKLQEQIESQLRKDNKLRGRFLQQTYSGDALMTTIAAKVPPAEEAGASSSKTKTDTNANQNLNVNAPVFVPRNDQGKSQKKQTSLFTVDSPVNSEASKNNSDEVDTDNEEDWLEKPDFSNQCYKCLFSDTYFTTAEECLNHMIAVYNFDLDDLSLRGKFSFYDIMKIINFTRMQVIHGVSYEEIFGLIGKRAWDDLKFMFPTFEDDQLLYSFQTKIDEALYKNNVEEEALIKDLVIPEDVEDIEKIKANSILKELITPAKDILLE